MLYYWANTYGRQLVEGEEYEKLKKTISIVIIDHEIKELRNIKKLGEKWQIRNEKNGKETRKSNKIKQRRNRRTKSNTINRQN